MVVVVSPNASAGQIRNVGLRLARGDYVAFFDAPVEPAPGAVAAMVKAHDAGHAFVAGELHNLTPSAVGWASYFDDPGRGSFARTPLLRLGGFDDVALGVEALAREKLLRAGHRAISNPLLTFGHRTELATAGEYVRARFALGGASPDGPVSRPVRGGPPAGPDETVAYDRVARLRRQGAWVEHAGRRWARLLQRAPSTR
jgi:glycosyltransferase involved in cell wall biosynthesis